MAPPPAITPLSGALRRGGGTVVCGSAVALVSTLVSSFGASPRLGYLAAVAVALPSLLYLGASRASLTHQRRRALAAQTCALALPCVLIARLAGARLAGGSAMAGG